MATITVFCNIIMNKMFAFYIAHIFVISSSNS